MKLLRVVLLLLKGSVIVAITEHAFMEKAPLCYFTEDFDF